MKQELREFKLLCQGYQCKSIIKLETNYWVQPYKDEDEKFMMKKTVPWSGKIVYQN